MFALINCACGVQTCEGMFRILLLLNHNTLTFVCITKVGMEVSRRGVYVFLDTHLNLYASAQQRYGFTCTCVLPDHQYFPYTMLRKPSALLSNGCGMSVYSLPPPFPLLPRNSRALLCFAYQGLLTFTYELKLFL